MEILFLIIILVMSVVIHEVSHGYAALALGDPTAKYQGRLTLNPISHLDPIGSVLVPLFGFFIGGFIIGWAKPVPFNPYNLRNQRWGEALVAIAGPASNLLLALLFSLILRSGVMAESGTFDILQFVVLINITLAIFNLIPIPPLDGSKILFSLFPTQWLRLREQLEQFGLIFVFFLIFFLWRVITPIVRLIFLFFTGTAL